MKCLSPQVAFVCGLKRAKDGVYGPNLVFSYKKAVDYARRIMPNDIACENFLNENQMSIPCGKCDACRIQKRKDMGVRLSHERALVEDACMLTLTYNDEHLPMTSLGNWKEKQKDLKSHLQTINLLRGQVYGIPTLVPADVQKFMKRLRRHLEYLPKKAQKRIGRDYVTSPIRYFCVGEYGGKTHRPHYHIIIFGWKPSDLTFLEDRENYILFRSKQVEKLWTFGFSTVGEVNNFVAKYCARYVTKKITKPSFSSKDDFCACPEFFLQSSRGGGMGAGWLKKYATNLRNGFVTVRTGKDQISKCSVPRYYYDRLRRINLPLWLELREEKIEFVMNNRRETSDQILKAYDDLRRACDKFLQEERGHVLYKDSF